MSSKITYQLDGDWNYRAAAHAVESLRGGDSIVLKMYSDDYMKEYLSKDDYEYWLSEKRAQLVKP